MMTKLNWSVLATMAITMVAALLIFSAWSSSAAPSAFAGAWESTDGSNQKLSIHGSGAPYHVRYTDYAPALFCKNVPGDDARGAGPGAASGTHLIGSMEVDCANHGLIPAGHPNFDFAYNSDDTLSVSIFGWSLGVWRRSH